MIALSYSRMQDMACPFRFKAIHIDRTYKEPETRPMRVGNAVHELLHAYREYLLDIKQQSQRNWLEDPPLNLIKQITKDKDEIQEILDILHHTAKHKDMSAIPVDADTVITERRFAFNRDLRRLKDWFDKKTAFRMIADLMYVKGDTLYVIDDKTGWSENDHEQLRIYAALATRALDKKRLDPVRYIDMKFYDHRKGKIEQGDILHYDDPEIALIFDEIKEKIKEVNSWTEFPAIPCSKCQYCGIKCDKRDAVESALVAVSRTDKDSGTPPSPAPALTVPNEIASHEQAQKAVEFVLFADSVVNRVKGLLREWVEKNGPVQAASKVAELRPNNPWRVSNTKALLSALLVYGANPDLVWKEVSVSESGLEKIAKKSGLKPEVIRMLKMTYGERKSYKARFGLFNA